MSNTSTNTSNKQQSEELGALWKRTSKGGMQYLAGHVIGSDGKTRKVVVFRNDKKTADNQPDYRMYESKPLGSNQSSDNGAQQVETAQAASQGEDLL